MNETIELMMKHRSVRKFKPDPVSEEQLATIVAAGQMASSSSSVQAYSVVAVTEPELKSKLAALAGNQAYVEECPVFLVWCADLYRLSDAAKRHHPEKESYADSTENFMVATIDVALASQNAALAAESLGFGIVYIGGLRNKIEEVTELLGLPEGVYPVFGMCVGIADQETGIRPRLPLNAVLHRNRYDAEETLRGVESYDETTKAYMAARTNGERTTPWSELMAKRLTEPARLQMKSYLEGRGFMKR
ncbi:MULTISPECIES: oxygen-insensitive NADPH nitroreductase [Paenibacillus]|uniref:oxygen-insensitive NADPH nitroreductase n=1 Tax=Paenibacillus TaxID=44249 RepID=UPI00129D6A55|nr:MULTISPECIES: oxygen-insensitive NADPH nitroreductase [Paenibacillus]MBY0215786.1 oxygen-insensitive NADPH nitroreductase [Paenibacillus illinoisensis]MCM3207341.1 oxygen-insensitive NADPH nitroreductase [Paenibacillus illinoisensis]WJH31641.1 oxygen-insensitive NADPH nitroreductase [Paenibacillus sp. CC-CFT742]